MFMVQRFMVLFKPLLNNFPKVAALYRGVRDQLDSMVVPQLTPWGFRLAGNLAMAEGRFEPVETALLRKLLKEVDILVNVGANVGYYCCHALSMGKSVIAFEPIERNLRLLCKNVKVNHWDDIEIFPIALSNKIGVLEIYGGNTGASVVKGWAGTAESYQTLVPCSTLNTVLNTRLNGKKTLILIDVEGAEQWALEGASILLNNDIKPIWIVEIASKELQPHGIKINPNFKNTFQLFFDHGYLAFDIEEKLRPITLEKVNNIFKGNIDSKSNNFVFISPDVINYLK